MLPLRDENPTRRAPIATVLILLGCLWIYFAWQPAFDGDDPVDVETPAGVVQLDASSAFTFENAAVPCEVVQGRPLSLEELATTVLPGVADAGERCDRPADRSPEVFPDKSVWLSLFTSMFLHGGLLHLGGNLLFLWIFANNIEDHLGHVRFALFYVAGGLVATATHIALNLDSTVPVVGASGAIAAVMGAYLVWFPRAPVLTFVFLGFFVTLLRVRAMWLLGFWFVSQFFTNPNSGVAWGAHVGGFVFGVVLGLIIRSSRSARRLAWTSDYRDVPSSRWDDTGGVGAVGRRW